MTELRLKAYEKYLSFPIPSFGPDLTKIDFDNICYYVKPTNVISKN
jgi:Fe-S cluster assembly protein SufB